MNPERKVVAASEVLREMLNAPAKGIPLSMIADAEAVVIIPEVVKVGFVVGVQRGEGVVLVRDQNRVWQLPRFITITAGSVGWQIGAESSDFVLVFKTRRGVDGLMNGKFTIGADANAAIGPVGRQIGAATDAKLGAEIYTYSRSRGLFAGVSLAGSSLDIDSRTDAAFYGNLPGQPPAQVPQSALQLVSLITSVSEGVQPAAQMPIAGPVAVEPIEQEREAILASARALGPVLDDQWRQYLALPESLSTPGAVVDPASLKQVIDRFNTIAQDQRYAALNKRPEFNATHDALTRYYNTLTTNTNNPLNLPPPPLAN
jgi:lipid-binding SYLF domain-containing protein